MQIIVLSATIVDGEPKIPFVDEWRDGGVFLEYESQGRVEEAIPSQAEVALPMRLQVSSNDELKERQ